MSSERYRPNVLVAEYVYRHEAEFAAGFLTDAGIPHRLQADDAGGADMGATMGRPARIWVRAEDAPEARELLEVTPEAAVSAPPGSSSAQHQSPQGICREAFWPAATGLYPRSSGYSQPCSASRSGASAERLPAAAWPLLSPWRESPWHSAAL